MAILAQAAGAASMPFSPACGPKSAVSTSPTQVADSVSRVSALGLLAASAWPRWPCPGQSHLSRRDSHPPMPAPAPSLAVFSVPSSCGPRRPSTPAPSTPPVTPSSHGRRHCGHAAFPTRLRGAYAAGAMGLASPLTSHRSPNRHPGRAAALAAHGFPRQHRLCRDGRCLLAGGAAAARVGGLYLGGEKMGSRLGPHLPAHSHWTDLAILLAEPRCGCWSPVGAPEEWLGAAKSHEKTNGLG